MALNPRPNILIELCELLKDLPGIGKRSAERMAFSIYRWDNEKILALSDKLKNLHNAIHPCPICGNLSDTPEQGVCSICASPYRDKTKICVVEDIAQIYSIETADTYSGVYHVLGGLLAPALGKYPENLHKLEQRVAAGGISELILALSQDLEGQVTSVYITEQLESYHIKITRLACGLPAGSDLSYADPATIAIALNARISMQPPPSDIS